jgi:hypothetical protein
MKLNKLGLGWEDGEVCRHVKTVEGGDLGSLNFNKLSRQFCSTWP